MTPAPTAAAGARVQIENGSLPRANIGLWKVAKISYFLATFKVHPWIDLTFHEPLPQMIEMAREARPGANLRLTTAHIGS